MSGRKQAAVVSRSYQAAPDECARAIELLLKKSVSEEGAHPGAPENAKERINDDFRAGTILQHGPS